MIPVFENGPDGFITRTINSKFPPEFAGESMNVPERRALVDVWYEVSSYIENVIFPRKKVQKSETGMKNGMEKPLWIEMKDKELSDYLMMIFSQAHYRYNNTVANFFPSLRTVLNLSAQYPCYFAFATDRVSVLYAYVPVDSEKEIASGYAITDTGTLDIASPKVKLLIRENDQANDLLHEQFVVQELKKLNKYRSPLHPIKVVDAIDKYFNEDPINELAREWLIADLRAVFGF